MTELLYLRDATLRRFDATVEAVEADGGRVALDRTAFYPTGGGQPHDTGTLAGRSVIDVRKDGELVWHTLDGGAGGLAVGDAVSGEIDWDRRHRLMRTHTALHILCGVMWHEHGVAVTGGDMQPLSARMDFGRAEAAGEAAIDTALPSFPEGFAVALEARLNDEVAADRSIEVSFLPRSEAVLDEALIRTKVSLVPENVPEVRVVDIVGLDKQADGGTHVASTGEVGRIRVTKTENKGKGFRRVRIEITEVEDG